MKIGRKNLRKVQWSNAEIGISLIENNNFL